MLCCIHDFHKSFQSYTFPHPLDWFCGLHDCFRTFRPSIFMLVFNHFKLFILTTCLELSWITNYTDMLYSLRDNLYLGYRVTHDTDLFQHMSWTEARQLISVVLCSESAMLVSAAAASTVAHIGQEDSSNWWRRTGDGWHYQAELSLPSHQYLKLCHKACIITIVININIIISYPRMYIS